MSQNCLDQPLPEACVALLRDDEDVGEVGKGRLIADDAGEPDLRPVAIKPERHRMSNCAMQSIKRDIARPVRTLGEKMMDQRDIETDRVSVDLIAPSVDQAAGDDGLGQG
jgi:hypothetical protein